MSALGTFHYSISFHPHSDMLNSSISTNYAREDDLKTLRANRDFQQYILKTAAKMMETIRALPDYWQVSHSKRTFSHLCECTKVVYGRCVRQTTELRGNGGLLVAQSAIECFRQSLISALELYERKFNEFLQLICKRCLDVCGKLSMRFQKRFFFFP